jgi:pimeloyl-ACP methyl ester carboxylesterase
MTKPRTRQGPRRFLFSNAAQACGSAGRDAKPRALIAQRVLTHGLPMQDRTILSGWSAAVAAVAAMAALGSAASAQSVGPPATGGASASAVVAGAVTQEDMFFNARIGGRIFRLDALVSRPVAAAGALPVALLLHGKDFAESDMERVRPRGMAAQARDLAERGWLVVNVVRRGFGRSDGPFPALAHCGTLKLGEQFEADADETLAVLDLIRQRPDVDLKRLIVIGVSAGGPAAMAVAARKPPGLAGVMSISGGLNLPDCAEAGATALVEAVRGYATRITAPQLWIYADNDALFPLSLVNRMHEAALGAGASIRRLSIAKLEPNGHNVFGSALGRQTWLGELDKSLRAWGLPTFDRADVRPWMAVVPGASRNTLERYQLSPGFKALVYSPSRKTQWWRYAVGTEAGAIAGAKKDCEAEAKDCKVMLVGNRLVAP